ncbi:MAG: glycosyltransferase family protein [Armatimonadota bacterium]
MNILVFTVPEWNDQKASGNTLSNLFGGWNDTRIFNICTRNQPPNNRECSGSYVISETSIIRHMLHPSAIGMIQKRSIIGFDDVNLKNGNAVNLEKRILYHVRKHQLSWIYILTYILWNSKLWQNRRFKEFVDTANPDVFVSFSVNYETVFPFIKYMRNYTQAKIIVFITDEVITNNSKGLYGRIINKIRYRNLIKCVSMADKVYGASPMLCDEYGRALGITVDTFYKGCDFETSCKDHIGDPIRIVYAGNLLYSRDVTLSKLAQALEEINKDSARVTLEIYTTADITTTLSSSLNIGVSSCIIGSRQYDEIKQIMAEADIVLHVESFDDAAMRTTRLSLSTKIMDCLQSGSCLMAIGPSCIASMEYIRGIDGAVVVNDILQLKSVLQNMVDRPQIIIDSAKRQREYALKHHALKHVRNALRADFEQLLSKDGAAI